MRLNKKVDINVGYKCNARCKFCFYRPFVQSKFFDLDLIKRQLRIAKIIGIENIDFTGGEPTLSKDIIPLIVYARSLGFKKLCVITNGILLSDIGFFQEIKAAGLNDVLFSLHGDKAEIHDYLTGIDGSFEKCLKAIENARILGIRTRINSVIAKFNYKRLPYLGRLVKEIAPEVASLMNINPCSCQEIYDKDIVPVLKETAPYAKEAIDILKDSCKVNVMYIPFCLMEGYAQYLHNMHQIQYDPEEWDYLSRTIVQIGLFNAARFVILRGLPKLSINDLKTFGLSQILHKAAIKALCGKNNAMLSDCGRCRYYFICDGPWKKYLSLYGGEEFKPATGKKIFEPYFFMEKEYQ